MASLYKQMIYFPDMMLIIVNTLLSVEPSKVNVQNIKSELLL